MVAVLNAVGLDWATFGNHEFDISEEQFRDRLAESEFGWVSANVTSATTGAYPGVLESTVLTFGGDGGGGGAACRLGIVGGVLRSGDPDWVRVADPISGDRGGGEALAPKVDGVLALTHLELDQDVTLAETVPEIDFVLGGHEHENWSVRRSHRPDAGPQGRRQRAHRLGGPARLRPGDRGPLDPPGAGADHRRPAGGPGGRGGGRALVGPRLRRLPGEGFDANELVAHAPTTWTAGRRPYATARTT